MGNHGEKILLRIRTDDFTGFRKYLYVRDVLMHELAHNRIGPHNAAFKALNSEFCRQVVELDWTKSKGHVLGTSTSHDLHRAVASRLAPERDDSSRSMAHQQHHHNHHHHNQEEREEEDKKKEAEGNGKAPLTHKMSEKKEASGTQNGSSDADAELALSTIRAVAVDPLPVDACLALLMSYDDQEGSKKALAMCAKILSRVQDGEKFRRLRLGNAKFRHLITLPGAAGLLINGGFQWSEGKGILTMPSPLSDVAAIRAASVAERIKSILIL